MSFVIFFLVGFLSLFPRQLYLFYLYNTFLAAIFMRRNIGRISIIQMQASLVQVDTRYEPFHGQRPSYRESSGLMRRVERSNRLQGYDDGLGCETVHKNALT